MNSGNNLLFYSILSGLLAGIFWVIGDILIVGFSGDDQEKIKAFENKGIVDPPMAAYMLPGSERRLRWGALIANYAAPLMFFSIISVYQLSAVATAGWRGVRIAALILMVMGYAYSPLAHAGFYFIGTLSKNLYQEEKAGRGISQGQAKLLNNYRKTTHFSWLPAIALTGISWFLFALLIAFGQSELPRFFLLLTPFTLSPLWIVLVRKFKPFHPYLNGAAFNLGMSSYYLILLIWYFLTVK